MNRLFIIVWLASALSAVAQNPMLVVKEGDFAKDAPEIKELAAALNAPIIVEAQKNPVCCVWVVKIATQTSDGKPGYVMLKSDSIEVFLTDLRAASTLAERLRGLKGAVPKGIMTNFDISDDLPDEAEAERSLKLDKKP
jgi:hypothetical protein